jgi:hypothetical protein
VTIIINSVVYDIPLTVVNRKIDKLYRYAERTADGVLHTEIIGVYKNYTFSCGQSANNVSDYNALISKLSEAVESYTITVLGDTYSAYFANISDKVVKDNGVTAYFRELTFDVIAISPAATP